MYGKRLFTLFLTFILLAKALPVKSFKRTMIRGIGLSRTVINSSVKRLAYVTSTDNTSGLVASIDQKFKFIKEFNSATKQVYAGVLHEKLQMSWTYNSLAIEGNQLTLGDTIFFLQNGLSVAGKRISDFLEVIGHSEAIDLLMNYIRVSRPCSKHFACQINQLLTGHVKTVPAIDPHGNRLRISYTAGRYSTGPTHVMTKAGAVHKYVEANLIEEQMDELIRYVNSDDPAVHPVVRAAVAHYNFVRIHPFQDGNGRGARLLMNMVLMKAGLYPTVVQVEEKNAYLAALRAADQGDMQSFVDFIMSSTDKTLDILVSTIKKDLM